MEKEVCIIKSASTESSRIASQPSAVANCLLNGNNHSEPMSADPKFNQSLLVSLESSHLSSVIQQAKDAKLNLLQPSLNFYPLPPTSSTDFADHRHKTFDQHHDSAKSFSHVSKNLRRPEKTSERSLSRVESNMVDNGNQANALYVMNSSGKMNVLDTLNREQFFLNNKINNDHGNNGHLFNVLGADLPQLKKALAPQYAAPTAYQSENLQIPGPSLALSDNYFNLFSSAASTSSSLSGDNLSSQSAANVNFASNVSPGLQSRHLVESGLSNGSNSFQSNSTAASAAAAVSAATENTPVVTHTRGRKRSKKGPFICNECRKEFSNQSTLTKHMITHSDERKFVCPQCSKAFKRHDHLNGHMLTHRENKPYACDLEGCDKSYCDARSLRRHREKHKENTLHCNEGLLLSQKLPGLTVTDKGIANNIYLPVNASAQLQYLALQQQKTTHNDEHEGRNGDYICGNSTFAKSITSPEKAILSNGSDSAALAALKAHEEQMNRRALAPSFGQQQVSNFAHENQLLHQLLTTTPDRAAFKSPIHSSHSANSNSTVIKLNEDYHHTAQIEMPASHLTLGSSGKNAVDKGHSGEAGNIFLATEKLPANLGPENALEPENENTFVQCTVCQKKFKTLSSLNGHMRLHGGNFKMNYLLSGKQEDTPVDSQVNDHQPTADNFHLPYPLEYQQQPKMFDNLTKDFLYGSAGHHSKEGEFNELNMYGQKSNVLDYHSLNHAPANSSSEQFKAPLQYDGPNGLASSKGNLHNSSSLYSNQMYQQHQQQPQPEKSGTTLMSQPIEQRLLSRNLVQTEPKQMGDLMFSPITPVTPLNKNNSQFIFDFSNANKIPVEPKIDSLGGKQTSMQYQEQSIANDLVGDSFCFDEAKENVLLEKGDDMQIPQIDIADSQDSFDLNATRMKNFAVEEGDMEKSISPSLEARTGAPTEDNFDDFDLPSGKLTSDLYNRRLRKHVEDSNRTRELLSIKKIAASLQSFSQSFERSHPSSSLDQSIPNHSYSVPTTPLVMGNGYHNNQELSPYQPNHMSHHSLPTTPIESSHFTFNVEHIPGQCQHQASLPSTPLENEHQFTFATNQPQQQAADMLTGDASNFDLSCLSETQYSNDFMYNTKDIDSHFIENESIMSTYEPMGTTDETNQLVTEQTNAEHNFTSQLYSRTDTFNYEQTCLPESTPTASKDAPLPVFALLENSQQMVEPTIKGPHLDGKVVPTHGGKHMEESSLVGLVKDINSNYIINCAEKIPLSIDISESADTKSASKGAPKASPLKGILMKKHSPPSSSALKKKHRPAPLYIPPHVNAHIYHSRLRSPFVRSSALPESIQHISPPPYTPPPMLSPLRSGPGLFWKITGSSKYSNHSSATSSLKKSNYELVKYEPADLELRTPTTAYEPVIYEYDIPHTDVQPHVNIGPNFQARIPAFNCNRKPLKHRQGKEDLLWDPNTLATVNEEQLSMYLKVSCSMCLPGQGNNREYALHLLHQCKGDLLEALGKLVNPRPQLNQENPLSDYHYADNQSWTSEEITLFQESLLKNDKDFFLISHEVKSKSVKQCIEFFYLWKKNFPDTIKRMQILRRRRETAFFDRLTSGERKKTKVVDKSGRALENDLPRSRKTVRRNSGSALVCEQCDKKFRKCRSLTAHMKIHL